MLLQGRPLRTRLDLLPPDTARRVEAKQLAQTVNPLAQPRQLEIGAKVLARRYRPGHNPWLPGSIATRSQCGLHYEVQVSPGILWRRHIDQLRSTSMAPVPLEPASEPALVPAQEEERGNAKAEVQQLCHLSRPQPEMQSFDRKYRQPPPALRLWKIKPPQRHPHLVQSVVIHSVNEERPSA